MAEWGIAGVSVACLCTWDPLGTLSWVLHGVGMSDLGGSLREYMGHECLKSSLAFRKLAVAAASRRPARADRPKVGLDPLSAPVNNPMVCGAREGPSSILGSALTTNICATVDGKVVVGRRLRHRAGVHRRHPQGQSSPRWPQWAAAWPLVPRSRTGVVQP